MRKPFWLLSIIALLNTNLLAQHYVNVTFRHYPTKANIVRAFVPGTFNNWGPNSNGFISPSAPSLMAYIDSLGCWVKSYRLVAGQTYKYKFHEHWNQSGSERQWFTDPLNPLFDANDYGNSILKVKEVMMFQFFPQNGAVLTEQHPQLVAGIFTSEDDSLLLDQSVIYVDNQFCATFENHFIADLSLIKCQLPELANGNHKVVLDIKTKNGETTSDSLCFTYQGASPEVVPLPAGVVNGINFVSDSTVTLVLHAPYYRDFVYVIGDFNDWQVKQNYFMKRSPNQQKYWLTIVGLDPDREYGFQYFVDGEQRIADPYTEKVLDPQNDIYILDSTYPNLKTYPTGKTSDIISTFLINQEKYQWQELNFVRPAKEKLVIYELLVRDFLAEHDYQTLIDSLDYFERLGINAIELMPVNEFEGNLSWGYNPSFYFAPDKYYGPKNDLQRFIDECHVRRMAVIVDMVLNHSFGQSPMVRLFSESNYGPPSSANIWYNKDYDANYAGYQACHPYNVGFDFNHEAYFTQQFVDSVNSFWLTEYRVDGFRFDLTKGFTQKASYTGNGNYNESLASQYDASRIAILKRMANHIWSVDSTAYVILEHFCDNAEEKELANYGCLLWGNANYNYNEATMGWHENGRSDFSWGYYGKRGWSKPHLVTYMESHDEERLMYKNLQWGNSSGDYSIKDLATALARIKLAAAFFFTLPGPKMIWQFGELGYDYSIDFNGRLGNKPIRWDYYQDPLRKNLYRTFAALIKLRKENEVFTNANSTVSLSLASANKRINISHQTMNATIIGNFGVTAAALNPNFQHAGIWYNYFFGDSLSVAEPNENVWLQPGEFAIFTDKKIESPGSGMITAVLPDFSTVPSGFELKQNYPNPFNPLTTIKFALAEESEVTLAIYNLQGQLIKTLVHGRLSAGNYQSTWRCDSEAGQSLASGIYLYRLKTDSFVQSKKMILLQ